MAEPYVVEVPLRWSDMDAYGHVNNVQYLRLLEDARVIGFRTWFPDRPTLVEEGIVVTRHAIEYRAPLTYRPAPVEVDMWVTRVHGAGFDLGYVVRDPEGVGDGVYAVAETGSGALRLLHRPAPPARPGGAGEHRRPRRRPGGLPLGWPVTERLRLVDAAALGDLGRYAARARALDDQGAMRLQAHGDVLAAWVGVLQGSGILAEGTVLGLRTFALAEPATCDVVVPLGAVTDRTSRHGRVGRPGPAGDPRAGPVVGRHPAPGGVGAGRRARGRRPRRAGPRRAGRGG